jgi:hypothetical protein
MALDTTGTILTIRELSTAETSLLPLYSARGLSHDMSYIDGAMAQERTINAELVDLSLSRFRKLRLVISATDVRPPSLDICYPGHKVLVECANVFSYPTIGGSPGRTPVTGSEFIEGDFTFYRPTIIAMIGRPSSRFEEWEAGNAWSLPMEEV